MKKISRIVACMLLPAFALSCNMTYNYNTQMSDSTKSIKNSDNRTEELDNNKKQELTSKAIQLPVAPNDEFVDYTLEYNPQVLLDEDTYRQLSKSDSHFIHEWKGLEGVITGEPTKEKNQYEIILTRSSSDIGALSVGETIVISFLSDFTDAKEWMGRSSMINLNSFMVKGQKIKFNCTDDGGTSIEFYFTYIKPLKR